MRTYYHGFKWRWSMACQGTHLTPHIGLCLTDDLSAAESYAQGGKVAVVELDSEGLTSVAVEVSREDREAVTYPGDDGALGTVDLLTYQDSDLQGRDHDTVRANSDKAVQQCRVVCIVDAAWVRVMASSGIDERAWPGYIKAWQALYIDDPDDAHNYLDMFHYDMGRALAAAYAYREERLGR